MSTLYLIRHGQASFGKSNYDRLSPAGYKQSRLLSEYLNSTGVRFDSVYCGTMERQIKTAGEYAACTSEAGISSPEIKYDARLNEFDAETVFRHLLPELLDDKPEYRFDSDNFLKDRGAFQRIFEAVMTKWCSGSYNSTLIPSWDEFTAGVNSILEEITSTNEGGRNIAAFTSGGPISVMLQRILEFPHRKTMEINYMIVNTSITKIKYSPGRIMIDSFNEYPHLTGSGVKDLITYR